MCPECGTPFGASGGRGGTLLSERVGLSSSDQGAYRAFRDPEGDEYQYRPGNGGGFVQRRLCKRLGGLIYVDGCRFIASGTVGGEERPESDVESGESKQVPFERVLFGLGIRFVGERRSLNAGLGFPLDRGIGAGVFRGFGSRGRDRRADRPECIELFLGREEPYVGEPIKRNRACGWRFPKSNWRTVPEKLKGLTIVISGTFSKHSRDEYKAMIEQHGGKNSGSVSGKTDYILAGENMGPAKLEKAAKLGEDYQRGCVLKYAGINVYELFYQEEDTGFSVGCRGRPHRSLSLDEARSALVLYNIEDHEDVMRALEPLRKAKKDIKTCVYVPSGGADIPFDDSNIPVHSKSDLNAGIPFQIVSWKKVGALKADILIDITRPGCYALQYIALRHPSAFKVGLSIRAKNGTT